MTVVRSGARAASPEGIFRGCWRSATESGSKVAIVVGPSSIEDESDGVTPDASRQWQRGREMQRINEVRTAVIVADHQQQAEYRRAIRAAACEQASRLEAKYRRLSLNDERFFAREPAAQAS